MLKQQSLSFAFRWLVSSAGMWLCITLFVPTVDHNNFWLFATAGLIFSVVNAIIKPIVKIFALPFIIMTLGLFTLIVNGAMVALTIALLPTVSMTFGQAILSSIIMSLLNSLANFLAP